MDDAIVLLAEASETQEIREEVRLFVDRYRSKKGEDTAFHHFALAKLALWEGDLDTTEAEARSAISLAPEMVGTHLTLASAHSARGDSDGHSRADPGSHPG